MPPGSANTLHRHVRQEEFYFVLEGLGRMRIGGETLTAHGMDFLLTWNCAPINNVTISRRIERICAEAGFTCPVICSPDELLPPSTE